MHTRSVFLMLCYALHLARSHPVLPPASRIVHTPTAPWLPSRPLLMPLHLQVISHHLGPLSHFNSLPPSPTPHPHPSNHSSPSIGRMHSDARCSYYSIACAAAAALAISDVVVRFAYVSRAPRSVFVGVEPRSVEDSQYHVLPISSVVCADNSTFMTTSALVLSTIQCAN